MSHQYFQEVVTNLSIEDVFLLTYLVEREADEKFKSVPRKTLINEIFEKQPAMTEATVRKTINRLEALIFIKIITSGKKQRVFITELGIEALNN